MGRALWTVSVIKLRGGAHQLPHQQPFALKRNINYCIVYLNLPALLHEVHIIKSGLQYLIPLTDLYYKNEWCGNPDGRLSSKISGCRFFFAILPVSR